MQLKLGMQTNLNENYFTSVVRFCYFNPVWKASRSGEMPRRLVRWYDLVRVECL